MYVYIAVLKNILRKKSMGNQRFNKVTQSSNTQHAISFKKGANVGPLCRSLEHFNVFTRRPP